ncbi:glycoside hydrolase [Meredithblackwellia eburnea MCA 4105]
MFIPGLEGWLKEATLYQIYPATFKDSNGDGVGDFNGITSKLDYLKDLGINGIWISPYYKSPQVDLGYDISDYRSPHEPYGTLSDIDNLIKEAHARGIKVLADLVINHTSDQHEWFIESRSSKTNPKRDWYFWHPGKVDEEGNRKEPTNWKGAFGGSAWEWDEKTQEYYLHLFAKEQPDVNWENPETRKVLFEHSIKFWMDRGIDGFRVDTVHLYSKDLSWPDAPIFDTEAPYQPSLDLVAAGPRIHEYIHMIYEQLKPYGGITIGELGGGNSYRDTLKFISKDVEELDTAIQFGIAKLDRASLALIRKDWRLTDLKMVTWDAQQLVDPKNKAWAITCLENHDLARSVSRLGSDKPDQRVPSAKVLATYLLTLSGTPIIYQGEELGMINIPPSWPLSEYKDINTHGFWEDIQREAKNFPEMEKTGLEGIHRLARDHARTPMQWTDEAPHAGFSTFKGDLWMRVNDNYPTINVRDQEGDSASVLEYYRTLIKLRNQHKDLFIHGLFELADPFRDDTFVFVKRALGGQGKVMVVALNFQNEPRPFSVPKVAEGHVDLALSSCGVKGASTKELRAWEARVYLPKE